MATEQPIQQPFDMSKLRVTNLRVIAPLFVAMISSESHAVTPASWRTECVGRTLFSLPPDVELAGVPHKSFAKELVPGGGAMLAEAQFSDGQMAGWNRILYVNGLILISKELDSSQIADLRSRFSEQPRLLRDYLSKRNTSKGRAASVSDVKSDTPALMSWSSDAQIGYLQQLQNHLLYAGVTSDTLTKSNAMFNSISKNTTYRELFSIPDSSGVCLPFAFIKDEGSEPRAVSVTYRIKSHPDVTVVLTDASAAVPEDAIRKRNAEPDLIIENFWAQYEVSRTGRNVSPRWFPNSKHTIELDGRKGLASYVNIIRKDDSKDVGFFATVPGDPTASMDVPELSLFVVREANHARAKGIEPIDEMAFLELAESIASSVRTKDRESKRRTKPEDEKRF